MESEEWCGGEMVRGTATRDSDNLRDFMCHCVCSFGMISKRLCPVHTLLRPTLSPKISSPVGS